MASEKSLTEEIKEAVTDDEHSIGEKAPGVPFVLVALSYVAILAAVCFAAAFFLYTT